MKKEIILLEKPLKIDHFDELYRRIFFISSDIIDFEIISKDGYISKVEISCNDNIDTAKISNQLGVIIKEEIVVQKKISKEKIWVHNNRREYYKDIFDQMENLGIVFIQGQGQVGVGEPLIKLMDYFDSRIKDIIFELFDAEEYRYPTLIPTKALEQCGCFDSFPQLLLFTGYIHNDFDVYKRFIRDYNKNKKIDTYALEYIKNCDYCLPPTMCYHTYHQLKDQDLTECREKVITSKGKSFRYESKYSKSLERLWDFTIREIVFIGGKEFVLDCRKKMMTASFSLMEELGLIGHSEIANDPFFATPSTAAKIFNQNMQALKYELRINTDKNDTISIASFNFHEDFFGNNFNIRFNNQEPVMTGCVGFGLERFVFAFLSQYGLDESKWPFSLNKN